MSSISSIAGSVAAYSYQGVSQAGYDEKNAKKNQVENLKKSEETEVKYNVSGKTIGNPKLSDEASRYYEKLKAKYSNMDFILVSSDRKEFAKAQAASYANANKMVVLIDEEKIEKMAADENYRRQYESIIANAAGGLSQLSTKLSATGANVKGYGMQVDDKGIASYFAVLEKSNLAQKERIEKKAQANKEAKKAAEKKAEKKAREEKLKNDGENSEKIKKSENTVTITASSVDELLRMVQEQSQSFLSDSVQAENEKNIGQKFDFSI